MGIYSVEKKQLSAQGMLQKARSIFEQVPEPQRKPPCVRFLLPSLVPDL